jgi:hypothetical protein
LSKDPRLAADTSRWTDIASLGRWADGHNKKWEYGEPRLVKAFGKGEAIDIEKFETALPEAEAPTPITPLLLPGPVPAHIQKRRLKRHSTAGAIEPVDLEELRSALMSLTAEQSDDHDIWNNTGQALFNGAHEGKLSEDDAFKLWDSFSAKGKKYKGTDDIEDFWHKFKYRADGARIGIGSIYHMAKAQGWVQSTPPPLSPEDEKEPTPGPDGQFGKIEQRFKLYGEANDLRVYDLKDRKSYKGQAFRHRASKYGKDAINNFLSDQRVHAGITSHLGKPFGAIVNDHINTFEGFDVKERPGDCEVLTDFIWEVIANQEKAAYFYILKLTAWAWQNRAKSPGVSLVLRSETEGTGKTTYAKLLTALFSPTVAKISQPSQMIGTFNSSLMGRRAIVAEEALFAGNPLHRGPLKDLVTNDTIRIELKYKEAFEVPNGLFILMLTNEEWAVPASLIARRWAVFDVPTVRVGDADYWNEVHSAIEDPDAIAAFAHFLKHFDLKGWHPRNNIPQTAALMEQKLQTTSKTVDGYFRKCLERGAIYDPGIGAPFAFNDPKDNKTAWAANQLTIKHDDVNRVVDVVSKYVGREVTRRKVARTAVKLLGAWSQPNGGLRDLIVPNLSVARAAFANSVGGKIEWDG